MLLLVIAPLVGAGVMVVVFWLMREYRLADAELEQRQIAERRVDESLAALGQELSRLPDRTKQMRRPSGVYPERRGAA